MSTKCFPQDKLTLITLPNECQTNILSFLRAFELTNVQQTCRYYNDSQRIHTVVQYFVDHVYGPDLAKGSQLLQNKRGELAAAAASSYESDPSLVVKSSSSSSTRFSKTKNRHRHHKGKGNNGKHHSHPNNAAAATTTTSSSSTTTVGGGGSTSRDLPSSSSSSSPTESSTIYYTLEDLRTIELNVVARVLSLPEPKSGFYVSKAWIKKTLLWLETVNDPNTSTATSSGGNHNHNSKMKTTHTKTATTKKLTKKQQRQRNRRLSDVSPPWPNANSDILCEHQKLQSLSSAKAGRSRRKLMDKHAWKILCKLYPDSTHLPSKGGECLQCRMEAETARKTEHDLAEQEKLERKKPLSNPHVRQFYTRSKGVPTHCLVSTNNEQPSSTMSMSPFSGGSNVHTLSSMNNSSPSLAATSTVPALASSVASVQQQCPLVPGTYIILPRAWCHRWRKYIKTGEGSMPLPPDSSALLCDAHKLALLPPHLEAYLNGETTQLLSSVRQESIHASTMMEGNVAAGGATAAAGGGGSDGNLFAGFVAPSPLPAVPVGVRQQPTLDVNMVNALMAAGVTQTELASQRMAMMRIEEEQQQQQQQRMFGGPGSMTAAGNGGGGTPQGGAGGGGRRDSFTNNNNNDLLDRENHVVVELVTQDEWAALVETGCWPKQVSSFCISVKVEDSYKFSFSTSPCRDCDPSGLRFTANASYCSPCKNVKSPKFRSKRWEPKSVEQKRIPNVEY